MTSQEKNLPLLNRRRRRRRINVCEEGTVDEPIAAVNPATPAPTIITFNGHAAWKFQFLPVLSWKCCILAFVKGRLRPEPTCALVLLGLKYGGTA